VTQQQDVISALIAAGDEVERMVADLDASQWALQFAAAA